MIDDLEFAKGQANEVRALKSIINCSRQLSVKFLYRCSGYLADGYFEDEAGDLNPYEIKSTLDFNSFCRAYCQLAGLRNTLPVESGTRFAADHIFFENIAKGWLQKKVETDREHISRLARSFGISRPLKLWQIIDDHQLVAYHEVLP